MHWPSSFVEEPEVALAPVRRFRSCLSVSPASLSAILTKCSSRDDRFDAVVFFPSFKALSRFSLFLTVFVALVLFPTFASMWADAPLNHFNLLLNHTEFIILLSNCENHLLSHIEIHGFQNPCRSIRFKADFETGIMYYAPFKVSSYFKWENCSCAPFTRSTGNGV